MVTGAARGAALIQATVKASSLDPEFANRLSDILSRARAPTTIKRYEGAIRRAHSWFGTVEFTGIASISYIIGARGIQKDSTSSWLLYLVHRAGCIGPSALSVDLAAFKYFCDPTPSPTLAVASLLVQSSVRSAESRVTAKPAASFG